MKDQLNETQQKVTQLFFQTFNGYRGGLNLSKPLIPLISENYLKDRVLILGQETNTWYKEGDDDLLNVYLKNYDPSDIYYGTSVYRTFIKSAAPRYGGKFWEFARNLYTKKYFNGQFQEDGYLGHCWINLFSVESVGEKGNSKGRPTTNPKLRIEVINLQKELLFKLMEILRPKLIIAFTGRTLDSPLFIQGLGFDWSKSQLEFIPVDTAGIFDLGHLAEVKILLPEHPLFNTKFIRCYHPTYFMGRINTNKKLRKLAEEHKIEGSISKHYSNAVENWIKKNA